jgi:hypothetical protein
MINTNEYRIATLKDLRYAIADANPTMFKDLTTKELRYIVRRVMPIKIDKEPVKRLMPAEVLIKALYEDVTQSDIPNTMNIWLDTWNETLSSFYQAYVLEKTSVLFIID